jgi:hypothetical protein
MREETSTSNPTRITYEQNLTDRPCFPPFICIFLRIFFFAQTYGLSLGGSRPAPTPALPRPIVL